MLLNTHSMRLMKVPVGFLLLIITALILVDIFAYLNWAIDKLTPSEYGLLESAQLVFLGLACLVNGYYLLFGIDRTAKDMSVRLGLEFFLLALILRECEIDQLGSSHWWSTLEIVLRSALLLAVVSYLYLISKRLFAEPSIAEPSIAEFSITPPSVTPVSTVALFSKRLFTTKSPTIRSATPTSPMTTSPSTKRSSATPEYFWRVLWLQLVRHVQAHHLLYLLVTLGCLSYLAGWPFDKAIFKLSPALSTFIEETLELNACLLFLFACFAIKAKPINS